MIKSNFISNLHIVSASLALLTAAVVLLAPKGPVFHKLAGYIFAVAILLVNISAAFMYKLTGHFNFLHVFIFISMFSLIYGLVPAILKKPQNWLRLHISGMTGAALGVWAAGMAEFTIRVLPGFLSVRFIIATAIGMGVIFFFLIYLVINRFVNKMQQYS